MLVQSVTKRPMCQYVTRGTLAGLNDITREGCIATEQSCFVSAMRRDHCVALRCQLLDVILNSQVLVQCAEVILPRMLPVFNLADVGAILL